MTESFQSNHSFDLLRSELMSRSYDEELVVSLNRSGYGCTKLLPMPGQAPKTVIVDHLYGNKMFSGLFDIDLFLENLGGQKVIEKAPSYRTYQVGSREELVAILADLARTNYVTQGLMSFRGQTEEYKIRRAIPNPYRSGENGDELSILPGAYRQPPGQYTFDSEIKDNRMELMSLGANNPFAYDPMRIQQHYLSGTRGLDVTFDIDVALFFATHKFSQKPNGKSTYFPVPDGTHQGVIYGFVFRDPPVRRSEFEIKKFDLFKDNEPTRILRQVCGLPLIGEHERNMAICDIDFIAYLNSDYRVEGALPAEQLFPPPADDPFYQYALKKKRDLESRECNTLKGLVEYEF